MAEYKSFVQTALELHNMHRADHGVPALQIDEQLNREAQAYAEKECKSGTQQHSSGPFDEYGENLAYHATSDDNPRGADAAQWAVGKWYDEIDLYDFKNPGGGNYHKWGHFTTVVWKGAKKMGIGVAYGTKISAKSGDTLNTIFVCARYLPASNDLTPEGMRANVLPPK